MPRYIDVDAFRKEHRMNEHCEDCERNARECQYNDFSMMDFCGWLDDTPAVEAVPLDKLCEYLNSVIYPCIICKESPGPQCNAKRKGCWNRVLTKWMEGLDDHNGTD